MNNYFNFLLITIMFIMLANVIMNDNEVIVIEIIINKFIFEMKYINHN